VSLDLVIRMTNWLAVDIDRAELIYVQNYPARSYARLLGARDQEKEPERVTVRVVGKDTLYTRRLTIPAGKLGELVCVANVLWKASDLDGQTEQMPHGYATLTLVDSATARSVEGLGLLKRDAGKLEEMMMSLQDPQWDWWDVF
jgi:hypothetical protein